MSSLTVFALVLFVLTAVITGYALIWFIWMSEKERIAKRDAFLRGVSLFPS